MRRLYSNKSGFSSLAVPARLFSITQSCKGRDQLADMPSSSTRIPKGMHSGPGRRMLNKGEVARFEFVKKWELQMQEKWDAYEAFKGQPKPKKQFGNEACEIIWPYTVLLENIINVHRFTKSIYVYYPQRQETRDGAFAAAVAKRFSHQYLAPITFHNAQCYVETEMLVEYGEVPWVVIHCLDGKHEIVPIKFKAPSSSFGGSGGQQSSATSNSSNGTEEQGNLNERYFSPIDVKMAAEELLNIIVSKADALGNAVSNVAATATLLHDRPPQNQYLRINYQWYGDTIEERSTHLVHWNWDESKVIPSTKFKDSDVRDRLNYDGRYPNTLQSIAAARSEKNRIVKGTDGSGLRAFKTGQAKRQSSRYVKSYGSDQKI